MRAKHSTWILGLACTIGWALAWSAEPIKIGMVVESTGAFAEYGQESIRGAAIAIEEINSAGGVGGRPLEIVTQDNQSTNPGSVVAIGALVADRDVKAIITTLHSSQIRAMLPAIEQAGIPALIGGTSHTLTHANNPWIFRVRPNDSYSAKTIAEFGVQTLKKKRWAIVHAAEAFGVDAKDDLVRELKTLGAEPVLVEGVNVFGQNFNPIIAAIGKADVDIVALYLSAVPAGNFAKQLRQAGVAATLIGSSAMSLPLAKSVAGNALDNSYSARDYVPDANPQSIAFGKKYRDKWGREPDGRPAWVYDAVNLLAVALRNAGSTSPPAIRKALLAIQNQPGLGGAFSFDQNGDGRHGYIIVRSEGDKIVVVKGSSDARP
jgi:branched-chain amino acid transport system substrate-binding protein